MGVKAHAAPESSLGERMGATFLCFGMGVATSGQAVALWAVARAHAAGGAPAWVMGAGLLVAVAARSLAVLVRHEWSTGDELGWAGLLLGAGVPVAFTRMGPATAPLAMLAAGLVWAIWWLQGQVGARALTALSTDVQHARREGDLGLETQGAVFGAAAMAAAADLLVPALFGSRPGPVSGVLLAAQCGCACVLVALVHRRTLLRAAAIEGATILPEFGGQSSGGVLAIAAAAVTLGAVLPRYAGVIGPGLFAGLGHAFAHLLPSLRPAGSSDQSGLPGPHAAGTGPVAMANGGPGDLVIKLLAELMGLAVVVLVAWGVVRLTMQWVRHRAQLGWPPVGRLLAEMWRALIGILRAIWAGLRTGGLWSWLSRAGGRPLGPVPVPTLPPVHREAPWGRWGDPRMRVRTAYRRLLTGAVERGHRRPSWATPRRFRALLTPALPPDPQALAAITRLYEEARYSRHTVDEHTAGTAEAAAQEILRTLRDAGGAARRP